MSAFWDDKNNTPKFSRIIFAVSVFALLLTILIAGGCPRYNVWEQGLVGQAALSRATQDRQVAVQEAVAKREAATELARAEVERAKGVAEANKIIADSLKGNEAYLRYLWVTEVAAVGKEGKTVVYVPTEANMPIMEANRKP